MKTRERTIKLKSGKSGDIKAGHPWIYSNQISKPSQFIAPGSIVMVLTRDNKFLGRGYYNPKSQISVRLISSGDEPIDKPFFDKRIEAAYLKRKEILKVSSAWRAVFSEADALPGLIVDVYSNTAVFQILTLGMERLKEAVVRSIKDILKPEYIYEKSDSLFRKLEGLKPASQWWGAAGSRTVEIFEGNAKFLVDIMKGHKTGFYLDQRKSRLALANIARGKKVLDLFCYTGAFSVSSALSGAASVLGVDIKKNWLDLAAKNAGLNGVSDRIVFQKGEAFTVLKNIYNSGEKFDIIILDPPSFMRNRKALVSAAKGYEVLNTDAMKALSEGGVLATFSCSHNMPNEVFSDMLKESAADAGKSITILKRCHQAEDHPIIKSIPETEYLKGYFLKVNSL